MDEFSYLSVLLSIILGLAIAQVLQGFRGILQSRKRVVFYWPSLVWSVLLLLIFVQSWWAMFGLRTHTHWTFAAFGIVLLQTICLYMLAGLVLPDFAAGETIDLRENYFAHRGWFFGIAVANGVVSIVKDLVLSGLFPNRANLIFHAIFIGTCAVAAITARVWYHAILAATAIIMFVLYILLLFANLR